MISAVTSTLSGAGNSASSRIAKIDALSKQANTLRQQLAHVQQPGAQETDATKTNSISQELVTIQSQIERLLLDGQLSRLTTADESGHASAGSSGGPQSDGASTHKAGSKARQTEGPGGSKRQDPYHVAKVVSGNIVDVQA